MMKVYNDNIKPEFTSFGKIAIGDTFAFERANGVYYVYIKTNHACNNESYNCICLSNGKIEALASPRITSFSAEEPVRLIDCELHWKFRDKKNKDKGIEE